MADDVPPSRPKRVRWIGSSLDDLRSFPSAVKKEMGFALMQAQFGRPHVGIRTLSGFGSANVREIRARDDSGAYRVVFTVEFADAIYVLHSFQKKSTSGIATPKPDMDRVRRRLLEAQRDHEKRSR